MKTVAQTVIEADRFYTIAAKGGSVIQAVEKATNGGDIRLGKYEHKPEQEWAFVRETCFFCKGEMKPSTTIHTVQLENCVVVIKNVPCMKCEQCGEVVLSADTIEKIERILQMVEKAVAEITVVNFPDCAA